MENLNVMSVVDNGMCNGCCECIGACPENSIYILLNKQFGRPMPYVATEDCSRCGECVKVCKQAAAMQLQMA